MWWNLIKNIYKPVNLHMKCSDLSPLCESFRIFQNTHVFLKLQDLLVEEKDQQQTQGFFVQPCQKVRQFIINNNNN